MTIGTFLNQATKTLQEAGIESARLDSLLILEDGLAKDRAYILAHPEAEIPQLTEVELNNKIAQRNKHEPLAYIRGHTSFYGRDFAVNRAVLVPRPETEAIIALAQKLHLPKNPTILDIGTGSGCIGITLALEVPNSNVYLYDIDDKALSVATENSRRLGAKISIAKQHLLAESPPRVDLIVTNLPYVPEELPINKAAEYEPKLALFSGEDGLDLYRELWLQLKKHRPTHVIAESFPSQHRQMTTIAKAAGYTLVDTEGFAQHFSLLVQRRA